VDNRERTDLGHSTKKIFGIENSSRFVLIFDQRSFITIPEARRTEKPPGLERMTIASGSKRLEEDGWS
jgi:hypothetical protein